MIEGTHIETTEKELVLTFVAQGDFTALHMATNWCVDSGYSVGSLQADAPTGILRGDVVIPKWRHMTHAERNDLDGTMNAPGRTYRTGPVFVRIKKANACSIAKEEK